jgi:predicted PolB exonuclease-like 3'-5' exonuclease
VLSNFGASTKPSLNELAALCGIPGKDTDIDGSQVEAMVNANRLEDVTNYCESDVVTAFLLYLRFALISGELGGEAYHESLQQVRSFIEIRIGKRPHLSKYLSGMSDSGAVPRGVDDLQN